MTVSLDGSGSPGDHARRYVAVVGPGDSATATDTELARDLGRLLAQAGAIVLTGGLGGVMAAATEGANAAGGTTVALLPGTDRCASAATVAIATGLGEMRNALLVRAADAVIAVGGSWGTLSEVALAMRTGVPVVSIGGWQVRDSAGRSLEVRHADSPAAAVAAVL
jgi:uncharacterized protein (TIGR00725 family)